MDAVPQKREAEPIEIDIKVLDFFHDDLLGDKMIKIISHARMNEDHPCYIFPDLKNGSDLCMSTLSDPDSQTRDNWDASCLYCNTNRLRLTA